jgi:5-methylcytosine-specific restriction protein A
MKRTRIRSARITTIRSGEAVPAGEPKRYRSSHGYVRLRWLVGPQEYLETYEHRVVDGFVTNAEHVHHDNRVKDDNSGENLVPLTAEEHNRLHAEERRGRPRPPRPKGFGQYAPYPGKDAKEKAERAQRRRDERRARAMEMRRLYLEERLTTLEISERVGLHHSGVSRELRAIGVRLRGGGTTKKDTGPSSSVRSVVTARAQLCCERCGVSVKWAAHHHHHRRPRQMGGDTRPETNLPSNLLLLCSPCHSAVESSRQISYERGWLVHAEHDPATRPVWLAGRGLVLLRADGSTIPYGKAA